MTERLSNTTLGGALGVSHATVSRIRSGNRNPSVTVMRKISKLTGWTMDDQAQARVSGVYPQEFEHAFRGVTPEDLTATLTQ